MVSYHLEEGVAAVTGAASGIGRATAVLFAEYGCQHLVLGDINVQGLEETRNLISKISSNANVEVKELDVGDEGSVQAFYELAVSKFGRVDFGVNVAGIGRPPALTHESTAEELEKTFHVNLRGVWLSERALLTQMLKQESLQDFRGIRGSIVNVASAGATLPLPGFAIYSGTKGGVLGITRTDALDYGSKGIRVNCVAPGFVDTPMIEGMTREQRDALTARVPLGRMADAREVANAIVWLISPNASYLNGAYIPIDGGFYLKSGG